MALGFNYTLSVDETKSLNDLNKFLEKIQDQKVTIGLDFDMDALNNMLDKIQKEIDNASKNMRISFGNVDIDTTKMEQAFKKAADDVDIKAKVTPEVDMSSMKGITQPFEQVTVDIEREINRIKDGLTISLNNLMSTATKQGFGGTDLAETLFGDIQESINELSNMGGNLKEVRQEAAFVRQEIASWSQAMKSNGDFLRTTATDANYLADSMAKINESNSSMALQNQIKYLQQNIDKQKDAIQYSKQFNDLTKEQKGVFEDLSRTLIVSGNSMDEVKQNYKELNYQLQNFKQQNIAPIIAQQEDGFDRLGRSIKDAVLNFNLVQEAIQLTKQVIRDAASYAFELDDAYTNISKTMNISADEFEGWVGTAKDIADANGVASDSVLDMMKIYAQAGADMDSINAQLEGATAFMNVSGLDATTVANALQSIMNQYNMTSDSVTQTAANIEHLGDVMTAVAYNLSKDETLAMQDIIAGIEGAGAVINEAGGDFEWFTAVIGTLSEQMGATGDETANAMKMIAARTLQSKEAIAELAETPEQLAEMEIAASNAEKALAGIGVSVRNETGEFKELDVILGEVAAKWDNLNNTEKQMVSEKLAGNNRRNYFISLMEGYEKVEELMGKAADSQGMFFEASEKQANSLEGVYNRFENTLKQLYQTVIDSDGLKSLISFADDFLQGLIKLVDFIDGMLIPALTALGFALIATNKHFIALSSGGVIQGVIGMLKTYTAQVIATTTSVKALNAAKLGLIGLLTGLAITGISKFIGWLKNKKTATEEVSAAIDSANETAQRYSETMNQMNDSSAGLESIKTLNKEMESLSKTSDAYAEKQEMVKLELQEQAAAFPDLAPIIENENVALEKKVELIQQAIDKKKEEALLDAQKELGGADDITAQVERALQQVDKYMMLQEAMSQMESAGVDEYGYTADGELFQVNVNGQIMALQDLQEELASVDQAMGINEQKMNQIIATYGNLRDAGLITSNEFKQVEEAMKKLAETMGWNTDIVEQVSDGIEEVGNSAEQATQKVYDFNDAMNENLTTSTSDFNDNLVNALEYLAEASELTASVKEGLSVDNMGTILDSDLMADFTGSITDAEAVIDHLAGKTEDLTGYIYNMYANMALADSDYWTQMVRNSAEALGLNTIQFLDYVNEKGLLREVDVTNAETAAEAEALAGTSMAQQVLTAFVGYINSKGGARTTDMQNVNEFLNAQGTAEAQTIQELAAMWQQYYNAKVAEINSTMSTLKGSLAKAQGAIDAMDKGGFIGDGSLRHKQQQLKGLEADLASLNSLNSNMSNFFAGIDTTFDGVGQGLDQTMANIDDLVNGAKGAGSKKGSSGSGSKGKGSSGGKSSTEKQVEDMEDLRDRYYELQDAIDDTTNALEQNQAAQAKTQTKEKLIKLQKEELKLAQQQIDAYKKLMKEQQLEANQHKNSLLSAGFKFDEDGNITNYAERLKKLQDYANSLSGEAKEQQIAYVESIVDIIEAYTDLTNNTIPDTQNTINDLEQDLADLKDAHEETKEAVKSLAEEYYELDTAMKQLDNQLGLTQSKAEVSTGQERVNLLQDEIDLLKQKQQLTQQQIDAYKASAKAQKEALTDKGVKFDEEGNISNYEDLEKYWMNIINSTTGDEQEKAKKNYQDILDMMDAYNKLVLESIPDAEKAWYDYVNDIAELEREKAEELTDLQKQISDAYEHELKKRYNAAKEALDKEQELYNKAYDDQDHEDTLGDYQRQMNEIQQEINNLAMDTSEAGQLRLKQLQDEYAALQQTVNDYIREHEKEQGNQAFEDEKEKLDEDLDEGLSPENIAAMVNQALVDGFVTIGDEVIELNDLMTTWLDETGDGLYAIGTMLKEDLVGNLATAKALMADMGLIGSGNGTGISQWTLGADGTTTLKNANNDVNANKGNSNVTVNFTESLLNIEGNVTDEVVEDLSEIVEQLKDEIVTAIAEEMGKY